MTSTSEPAASVGPVAATISVVLLADEQDGAMLARLVGAATNAREDCTLVRVDPALAALDREAFGAMLARHPARSGRTACIAYGDAVALAADAAEQLGAIGILALAPTSPGPASTTGKACRLDVIAPARAFDQDGVPAHARVHLVDLPAPALLDALELCRTLPAWLEAVENGRLFALPDLASDWRARLAHHVEVDVASAYEDVSGRFRLRGHVRHLGTDALRVSGRNGMPIRVGARVLGVDDVPVPGIEGRGGLSKQTLEQGEVAPFTLMLPRFDPGAGDRTIEVGLVCDDGYWFPDVGFAGCRLAIGGPDDREAAAPVTPQEAKAIVRLIYRAVLGRAADADGERYFADLLARGAMDERKIAWALIDSAEFRAVRARHGYHGLSEDRLP